MNQDDVISEDTYENNYFAFEYHGDGRKREAKRHKSKNIIAREEIDLE